MGKRPKKQVIMFLVEGESDKSALWGPLETLIEQYHYRDDVIVRFGHIKDGDNSRNGGDITSTYGVDPKHIEKVISKLMLSWVFDENHIYPKDVVEVIQVTDLDGAYIPDSNIVPELANDEAKNKYVNDTIITRDPQSTVERNERKRANIDYLVSLTEIEIWQGTKRNIVPYSIYYFSSNLDHYLHHNANIENPREKVDKAAAFSDKCVDDLKNLFKTFLEDADGICDLDYKESWDYIREGTNSVNRHSNLGVLIKKIISSNT